MEDRVDGVTLKELNPKNLTPGLVNQAFEDTDAVEYKDTEEILDNSESKKAKWYLEGMNMVALSVIVFSAAITVSLVLNIIFGNPQVSMNLFVEFLGSSSWCCWCGQRLLWCDWFGCYEKTKRKCC